MNYLLALTSTHWRCKWARVYGCWSGTIVRSQQQWRRLNWLNAFNKESFMQRMIFTFFIIMFGFNNHSFARCSCECVGGNVVPICQNATDLQPICPPRICPLTPPSIAPIQNPTLPPLGTSNCQQQQVLNPATGRYEWRSLCR